MSFGKVDDAKLIFESLVDTYNIEPDQYTYNTLIKGCVKNKDLDNAI